jgi:L-serine dehydratase
LSIFDVMGPIMIGPSSSHTAGASRIGYFARRIYAKPFSKVKIELYNSFAETGKGHGTDRALIGGLLEMKMDDQDITRSFEIAEERKIDYSFSYHLDPEKHPNLAKIIFIDGEKEFSISGISIGGGKVEIIEINGVEVNFTGRHEYLLLTYKDIPGMIGFIGTTLGRKNINIAYLQVSRDAAKNITFALLKLDNPCNGTILDEFKKNKNIFEVKRIEKIHD